MSQHFCICSGPSFTAIRGKKNCLPIFNRVQGEEEFEKSETAFGSLGPALSADIGQILIPQTQGYKIAFEGGTLI